MDDVRITTEGGLSKDIPPLRADTQGLDKVEDVLEGKEECALPAIPAVKLSKPDVRSQNAVKSENQLVWARGLTIKDVTLTKDGDDVDTLGPIQWSNLEMKVKEALMKVKEAFNKTKKLPELRISGLERILGRMLQTTLMLGDSKTL